MSTLRNILRRTLFGESDALALAPIEETLTIPLVASADASTAVAASAPLPVPYDCDVVGVQITQAASVASHSANYASFTLTRYKAASSGTLSAAVATRTTAAAGFSADVADLTTPATSLAALKVGDTLKIAVTKTGDGVSTAAGTVAVRVRRV